MGIPTVPGGAASSAVQGAQQEAQLQQVKNLKSRGVESDASIDKAASGFEALLLHQMMSSMWDTVEWSGMLEEDSNASQIYRDMFTQAISDSVAEGRGIGVKEVVSRELKKKGAADKPGSEG